MTRIKFSHLTSYLCDENDSKYFKHTLIMPPNVKNQTSYILKKAPE
jgi:hypothetical protein